ncbi:MAG: molybdenum cofactor biosynthesis protein, partial [Actinotalea sp.]|nr:molybdenum cofactor biosynthesis protein [Actinotalea sp.]
MYRDGVSHDPDEPTRTAAAVVVVSDRCARGEAVDRSGPAAVDRLLAAGYVCPPAAVVPDGADEVRSALQAALAAGARLVLT